VWSDDLAPRSGADDREASCRAGWCGAQAPLFWQPDGEVIADISATIAITGTSLARLKIALGWLGLPLAIREISRVSEILPPFARRGPTNFRDKIESASLVRTFCKLRLTIK
jgi:hypothetical protein